MVEKKYVDFIEKIINMTKEKKIKWSYLDENERIYRKMGWINGLIETPNFNTEKSFITKIDNFYIVIRTELNNLTDLYVIPSTFKNICLLKAEQYGEHITRLYNIVQMYFPDAEVFINSFLQES